MKPLLAHIYEPHRVTYPCYVQPKLNGVRALYQNGRFQSRDEIPWNKKVLAHLAEHLVDYIPPSVILDGELYVHGWNLQRILSAVNPVRVEPSEDTLHIQYHIFDVAAFGVPFIDRAYGALQQTVATIRKERVTMNVAMVLTQKAYNATEADHYYNDFVSLGYEGMMYRLGDCPYTVPKQEWSDHLKTFSGPNPRTRFLSDKDNRVWHMLKRKDWQDDEFICVGFNVTTGEKGERGFQLWCVTKNGHEFAVSSGLSVSEVNYYLDHSPVGRAVKVKYLVLSDKGIPQNATILAIL